MSLSQLLAKHILIFDHRTRYISIQILSSCSCPPAQLPLLFSFINTFQHLISPQPHPPQWSKTFLHSNLSFLRPKAGMYVWLILFVFFFLRTRDAYSSLHNAWRQLKHIFCPDFFNIHEVPSSRGSQVPSGMLGLEENSSRGYISNGYYYQKKFRPHPKTQTFTVIISGAYLSSMHHIFGKDIPIPWFYGAALWGTNGQISFITTSIFCRLPLWFPGHTQEWQSLSNSVKGSEQDA